MATLKDIAIRVGVDVSTVSKVLQGAPIRVAQQTRERIMETARQMQYRPNVVARALRLRKSGAIGIVVEETRNYQHPALIDGAEEAADELGYCLFLIKESSNDKIENLIRLVEQGRVDGLIHADGFLSLDHIEAYRKAGVPYISLNKSVFGDGHFVSLDDEAGFEYQLEHLVSLGHKQIVFVSITPRSYVSDLCRSSFLRAAKRYMDSGVSVRVLESDFYGDACDQVVETLLRLKPAPTAVATAGVIVAMRLMECLRARKVVVPDQLSVLAYHDTPVTQWIEPGISTIKMPSREHGSLGVRRLVDLINGKAFAGEVVSAPPILVERGSLLPYSDS